MIEGILGDKNGSILRQIDRSKPALIGGLMDLWRGYITGEYTAEGLDIVYHMN